MRFSRHITIVITLLLAGCAQPPARPTFIYKPVDLGQQRIDLTREYRCKHYDLCEQNITIRPQMIVLHWTAIATWRDTYNKLKSSTISNRPYLNKYSKLNTSAQFLVARDGTVYQLMPSNWMARHVIGLNYLAIGIENVGGVDGKQDLTPAQVNSDVFLINMLKTQYPSIEYLIGHYEYQCFHNTPLWKEQDNNYITDKIDPGPKFMREVRQQVSDLDLKGCPSKAT